MLNPVRYRALAGGSGRVAQQPMESFNWFRLYALPSSASSRSQVPEDSEAFFGEAEAAHGLDEGLIEKLMADSDDLLRRLAAH